MRSCNDCGQVHDNGYEALECTVRVLRADNAMRDVLSALEAINPGVGHEAMWTIVRNALAAESQTA